MRLGRTAALVICAALVGAAPAAAKPHDGGDTKVKQCKHKQHKRFACELSTGETVTTLCPAGYTAMGFAAAPDSDLNGNLVICFAEGIGATDDRP
jgi:hypothetical protein